MKNILKALNSFKFYLYNISWDISETLLRLVISFFTTILLARYLGPDEFGVFSYSLSLIGLFQVFGHLGLSGLIIRELVSNRNYENKILGTSLFLKLGGYVLAIILLFIFTLFTEEYNSDTFWISTILSLTFLFRPFEVLDFWFKSHLLAKYNFQAKALALVIGSIIKVCLIFLSSSLIFFAFANLIEALLIASGLIFFFFKLFRSKKIKIKFSFKIAKQLMVNGWKVFAGSIFAILYLKIDQIMLKWHLGSEAVGIYSVASRISEVWYFVPSAILVSFFPKLINLKKENSSLYQDRIQQLFDSMFIIAFIISILINISAKPLITFLFGESYITSIPILIIHIWASIFIFMREVFSKWLLIENFLEFSIITQGIGAISNIALNIWLIPIYGIKGAAFATLISYSFASYFSLFIFKKTRPIFFMMTKAIFVLRKPWISKIIFTK